MTISSTTRTAGPYTGDGSTITFSFNFKVFETTDLLVTTLDVATSAIAVLALTMNYSVTLNSDQDTTPGGTITLTAALAVGYTLTITTAISVLQGLSLTNGGAFYPDTINEALDLLTVLLQQLMVTVARCVQTPIVQPAPTGIVLPAAAARAGNLLGFDAEGNVTLVATAGGGTLPASQEAVGTVNGTNTAFTFTTAAATPVVFVFAGGVFQTPGEGADYTIGSPTGEVYPIAFNVAPTQGPITVVVFA